MCRQNVLRRMVMISLVITICALWGCSEMDNPSQDRIDDDETILAGRVIDMNGDPVPQLALFAEYIKTINEDFQALSGVLLETKTDETGRFAITEVKPGQIQFVLVPSHDQQRYGDIKYQLISVKIGRVIYYPDELQSPILTDHRASFSVTPGEQIENIEVTVKARMRIQGKIVFKDGTPLADWPIYLRTEYKRKGLSAGYSTSIRTDADGFFTRYVSAAGSYKVTARFQELTATSEQFTLKDGEHREDLVLMFDSEPIPWSEEWWW